MSPAGATKPVSGVFTLAAGEGASSAAFTPAPGRAFTVTVWGASVAPGAALGGGVDLCRVRGGSSPATAETHALRRYTRTTFDTVADAASGAAYALVCAAPPATPISYRIAP